MPSRRRLLVLPILLAIVAVPLSSSFAADVVEMKNGDRISGQLIGVSNKRISIGTSYAGILLVKQDEVASIESESEFTRIARDGSRIQGKLTSDLNVEQLMIVRKDHQLDLGNVRDWTKRIDLSAHSSAGNADVRSYVVRGESKLTRPKTEQNFTVLFEQEVTDNQINKDKLDAKYSLRLLRENGWFGTTNLDYLEDTPKEVKNRTVLGIGGGRKIWDHSQGSLAMEAAASGVYESRTRDSITSPAVRIGAEYKKVFFGGRVEAFHTDRFLWIADDSKGVIDSSNGVRLNLSGQLNLSFRTDVSYETQPQIDVSTTDVTYEFGMGMYF